MAEASIGNAGNMLLYGFTEASRLEASYARAFRQLGWRVEFFDAHPAGKDLSWWLRSGVARRLTRGSLTLRRRGTKRRNAALVERARKMRPDVVFLVNGSLVMPETVTSLRKLAGRVTVLHPDAPLPGNPNYCPEHLLVAKEADVCFVWSRRLKASLEEAGVRKAIYLPFAWDPEVFPHVAGEVKPGPEVVFVGGWDRWRESWLEPVAKRFDLEIWGPDYWGTRTRPGSPLRRCWRGGALQGREAAEVLASAAIVLNVFRHQNLPDGTNMRTFEVPGAGGFQLATRTSGAVEIYPPGEAAAYFSTVEELLERIAHFLEHEVARRAIARRAHAITDREHRYVHRAFRILSTLELVSR